MTMNPSVLLLLVVLSIGLAPAARSASCPAVTGHDYSNQDLTDHNFSADPKGSLVNANFTNAKLYGAIFAGQDLSGANFQSAKLGPSAKGTVDFTNTTLNKT